MYNNDSIRRQDRLMQQSRSMEILDSGEYGFLAMVSEKNEGYGIPLSYVWSDNAIYIHCAPEGQKLRALTANNSVSFCVVGKTKVISHQFTTAYESVMIKGVAVLKLTDKERMHALELILDKYSPNDKVVGMKYAENSFARTTIIKINATSVSGKCKVDKGIL